MNKMTVHLMSVELETGSSLYPTSVWGSICVRIGESCFPDEQWDDVVSSILDMCISEFCDFLTQSRKKCTLYFMDGPYWIALRRKQKGEVIAVLTDDIHRRRLELSNMDVEAFAESLLASARAFVEICSANLKEFTSNPSYLRIRDGIDRLDHGLI